MNYISTNQFPPDKVKLCKRDVCIEARGDNAKLIVGAIAFAIVCWGFSALIKVS
jgi:hypothetical protein